MVFGLGKKKEDTAPAAQMSPEAMAMLTQMAQQGGGQQAAPMAPSMPPAGAAQDQQPPASGQLPGQIRGKFRGKFRGRWHHRPAQPCSTSPPALPAPDRPTAT